MWISQSLSLDRGASHERVLLSPSLDRSVSPGRFSRSPSQDRSGRNTDNHCFNCGEEGHFSRDCIKELRSRSLSPFMRTPLTPLNLSESWLGWPTVSSFEKKRPTATDGRQENATAASLYSSSTVLPCKYLGLMLF